MTATLFEYEGVGFYRLSPSPTDPGTVLWINVDATVPADDTAPITFGTATEIAGGVYLFLNQPTADLPRLRSQLLQLRRRSLGLRFLWLQNPDAPLTQWRYEFLVAEERTLSRMATFDLGGYTLALPRRSTLELTETGWNLLAPRAYLSTGFGNRQLHGVADTLQLELTGCWRFHLELKRPLQETNYTELTALDIGFRLFFPDPLFSTAGQEEVVYQSQRYPLFEETASGQSFHDGPVVLEGCWTPLDRDRSFFEFPENGAPLPSGYRTNLGYTVYLTPQTNSRLVFAAKPASSLASAQLDSSPGGQDLYLVPQGEFELTVPLRNSVTSSQVPDFNNNLMCGLSGVEYIKISDHSTPATYIGFDPRQPAFAAGYTPAQELTLRLRDLLDSRGARSLQPFTTLEELLGTNRNTAIDNIFETLKQEFLPQGYQLAANDQITLANFVGSEIATLKEFEQWFQEILRLSRSRTGTGATIQTSSLNIKATTAWAYVRRDLSDAVYYAQPDQSILYKPSDTDNLFSFLEVSATDLTLGAVPGKFPMLPYGSLSTALEDSRQLELEVITPLRRAQIQRHYEQQAGVQTLGTAATVGTAAAFTTASDSVDTKQGTTPQGLLATFTLDERRMTELILARSRLTGAQDQFLKLLNIERGSPLWSALRANQLLLIVDDAESLKPYFDEPDTAGGTPTSHTQLTIEGWSFFFDTFDNGGKPRWRPDSVLIFKFHDKPLIELIEQPSAWSQVATFVGDEAKVKEVRQRLRTCFEDAISKDTDNTDAKTRKRYAPLANIARNPAWSGIIGINIPVPAGEGLPLELKALAGGIKDENFFARYVGIDNTPVRTENKQLVVDPSSLFGLIDYADDQPPEPLDSGYNFQVLSLQVLFENSRIADFASEIAITLDRLFKERTQLQEDNELLEYSAELIKVDFVTDIPGSGQRQIIVANLGRHYHVRVFDDEGNRIIDKGRGQFFPDLNLTQALENAFQALPAAPSRQLLQDITASLGHNRSGRNLVKLQGSTENHNGRTTYAFSFRGSNRFLMPNSAVFSYVDIVKAQFSSDPSTTVDKNGVVNITGRFSFWAQLGFRQLEKFDAFSFGPTAELPTEEDIEFKRYLRASNLVVTLGFPPDNPQDRSFAFIADDLLFEDLPKDKDLNKKLDLSRQSYRANSLYAKFPVTLTGFLQGTGKPKGFLPVKTAFNKASLDADWYGMAFDLDLGSLGGLSNITKLVSKLVILWLPNQDLESNTRPEPSIYIGMQLPGLAGDIMGFSLQSVLKLSFKTAEFLYNQSDGTYLLKLKAIVLKLLVLSLPPNGQTELLIFGNSEGRNQPIGWYAAYAKEPSPPP